MAIFTREQAEVLGRAIRPKLAYLVRLRERMEKARFTQDPLSTLVLEAEHALRDLAGALHYQSCQHGTGRPPGGD